MRTWRVVVRGAAALVMGMVFAALAAPQISGATTPTVLFAAPSGLGAANCQTAATACSLSTAITGAGPATTIELVTAGVSGTASTYYSGGFSISTAGTSSSSPVTIEPVSGLSSAPILDGGGTQQVLSVGNLYLDLNGVTVQNGSATDGGGISNVGGGTVTITNSTFSHNAVTGTVNVSGDGGAIDNGSGSTLTVTGSTFTDNTAIDGGAIDNADDSTSTTTASGSTFSGNTASSDGDAIDSGDRSGDGTLSVTDTTFSDNTGATTDGGAIDSGDNGGTDGLTVSGSTFSGNTLGNGDGGAIDSGDYSGTGTLSVTDTTFSSNSDDFDGGAIDQSDDSGHGTLTISGSTFTDNTTPAFDGGAIDIADEKGTATATVTDTTFTGNAADTLNSASDDGEGGAIDNGDDSGNANLTVSGSTFSGNWDYGNGGAINNGGYGGTGTLSVTNTTFSGNYTTSGDGGAIDNGNINDASGTATVTASTFTDNSAVDRGGAIQNGAYTGTGILTVTNSTFSGNTVYFNGAAIDNGEESGNGTLTVTGSTFSGNSTTHGDGGAIDNGNTNSTGTATVSDSTFSANTAHDNGGAIDNGDYTSHGTLTVTASTFSGNSALSHGGTIDSGAVGTDTGAVTLGADLIAGSCDQTTATWTDNGYNVGSDSTCFNGGTGDDDSEGSNLAGLIGPLADNGGPTETMAPLSPNPAIGIVPNPTPGLCPVAADQRGVASPTGQPCDAGAVQLGVAAQSAYTAVTPYRICDTRGTDGLSGTDTQCAGHTLAAGGTLTMQVGGTNPSGSSSGGVPATGVAAVVLNVTATGEAAQGYMTVWPSDATRPTASSLNYRADKTVPNLVTVELSATGQVSLYSLASTNVVVDVEGYYAAPTNDAGLFNSLTPYRICDTRGADGLSGTDAQCSGHTLSSGQTLTVQVTGTNPTGTTSGGVPSSGVSAVVLNVTAIGHGTGYLTAFPEGVTAPTASNLNFTSGQVVPNRVIVPVSASGQVSLTTNTAVDVAVDVNGWFTDNSSTSLTGAVFVPATPARICDTRSNGNTTPCAGETITTRTPLSVAVAGQGPVPSTGGVVAVVANLTVTDTTAQSYLTAWPTGQSQPTASDLNWVTGLTVPNMAVVGLGTGGDVDAYVNSGNADVIVDVDGWYVSESYEHDLTAQTNLTNALTTARANYVGDGSYASTAEDEVTSLSASEPSLDFVAGASINQSHISVGVYQQAYATTDSPWDVIILAAYSPQTGNCWWASDVEDPAAPTGYPINPPEPGTNYDETMSTPPIAADCNADAIATIAYPPHLDKSSYPTTPNQT